MKNKNKYLITEYLFRFYVKRASSFLANIYKAGITGTSKDIHRARLDVKKIFAIVDLLRIVRQKDKRDPGYEKIFKKLYKASGRIREIQVSLLLLTKPEFLRFDLNPFKLDLLLQENELTKEFLKAIMNFDEKKLARIEKQIKNEICKITPSTLQKKTNRYILNKTTFIRELLEKESNEKNLHQVRQHYKELSTVLTLVLSVRFSSQLEGVVDGLNRSEMMIGDWHDKVVLAHSLEAFLEHTVPLTETQLSGMKECHQDLAESNRRQIEDIVQELQSVTVHDLAENDQGSQ